jgi:hypothetical protein
VSSQSSSPVRGASSSAWEPNSSTDIPTCSGRRRPRCWDGRFVACASTALRSPHPDRACPAGALRTLLRAVDHLVRSGRPSHQLAAAGHSLGEYTALAPPDPSTSRSAGTGGPERGQAMAEAADIDESGMAALIGVDADEAEKVASHEAGRGRPSQVANVNAPGQIVVAGGLGRHGVARRERAGLGSSEGDPPEGGRGVPLVVHGAASAPDRAGSGRDRFLRAGFPGLVQHDRPPTFDGRPSGDSGFPGGVPVRFAESLLDMAATGVEPSSTSAPGDVTAGMARKTVADAEVLVVSDRETSKPSPSRSVACEEIDLCVPPR